MSDKVKYPIAFVEIGKLLKTFGTKGAMRFKIHDHLQLDLSSVDYLWINLMGCFIPHRILELDEDNAVIRLEYFENLEASKSATNAEIALPSQHIREIQNGEIVVDLFINWVVEDETSGIHAKIIKIEEIGPQMMMTLLVDDQKYWVPYVEEWVVTSEPDTCLLQMKLPEGMFSNPI